MTDQPQSPNGDLAGDERQIQNIIETGLAKWRAARLRATPHITVSDEVEMLSCITEYERANRGLPLQIRNAKVSRGVEWISRTFLDARRANSLSRLGKLRGWLLRGAQHKSQLIPTK